MTLRDALRIALSALPDSATAGPDGTGYKYAWDECTGTEQEWVKQIRSECEAAEEGNDQTAWVIDNIYTIARRESRRSELRPEMWGHVLRLCEKAGARERTVGVLRGQSAEAQPEEGR